MTTIGLGIPLAGQRVGHQRLQLVGQLRHLCRCLTSLCLLLGLAVHGRHHGEGEGVLRVPL